MIASIILMTIIVLAGTGMANYLDEPVRGTTTRKQALIVLGILALGVGIALLWGKKHQGKNRGRSYTR
jgi:membrane-associated phospholipid phosphatase